MQQSTYPKWKQQQNYSEFRERENHLQFFSGETRPFHTFRNIHNSEYYSKWYLNGTLRWWMNLDWATASPISANLLHLYVIQQNKNIRCIIIPYSASRRRTKKNITIPKISHIYTTFSFEHINESVMYSRYSRTYQIDSNLIYLYVYNVEIWLYAKAKLCVFLFLGNWTPQKRERIEAARRILKASLDIVKGSI